MRVVAWLGIVALCLAVTGCSLFGRRPWRANPTGQPGAAAPAAAQPAATLPPTRIGLLAGRVVDNFDQKPPREVHIQVIDLAAPTGSAPIKVVADDNGYFTIQGLEEKRQYRLVAQARDHDRLLAGNVFATASHSNLVIKISEDFVVPGMGDIPDWPGGKYPKDQANTGGNAPAGGWNNPPTPKSNSPVQLGIPTPQGQGGQPQSQAQPIYTPHPESIGNGPIPRADLNMPKVWMKGASGSNKATIPSCSGSRGKLTDFTLDDVEGQPWSFRQNVRGQLLLIDFWGSWCHYCVAGMPDVIDLYNRYGNSGLDVVGIAYEEDGPWDQQVQLIKGVRDSKGVPYPLLVGSGQHSCPVKKWFSVSNYPTAVLLDREGNVLWRAEGQLGPNRKQQLEEEIKRRLGMH